MTFQGKTDGILCFELMPNTKGCSYKQYEQGAISRGKSFEISQELFENIRIQECYLCGKQNSAQHKNGIDRVDNSKGYIEGNIMSCCSGCNYLKRDYNLDIVFDKFQRIYKHNVGSSEVVENATNKHIVMNQVKISKEFRQQRYEMNRRDKNKKLLEKYSNEEYKMRRAKELALMKKQKNQT